jgi:RsiW-degrading membrane proteinase PrsW (M82 family)
MRRHGSSLVFTVLVTTALAIGALVMGAVLLASGAPGALVIGTVLAAVPVAPLVGCYLWLDRYEPEPRSLLALALLWGALVATAAALLLQGLDLFVFRPTESHASVVVAPITEELAKGAFIVLLLLLRRAEFDGILDGIVYAGMVGIGFAFTENILYLASAYVGGPDQPGGLDGAVGLFVVRCLFSPFAHPLFTTFTGIGLGVAVMSRSRAVRLAAPVGGLGLAMLMHGLWNAALVTGDGQSAVAEYVFVMLPALVVLGCFALWMRSREVPLLTGALSDCARRGYVEPAQIPWLVSIPARRAWRRQARRTGGAVAEAAVRDYQREAIELAYLHHRYLRGTAPQGFGELGQAHVGALGALRPALVTPAHTHDARVPETRNPGRGAGSGVLR